MTLITHRQAEALAVVLHHVQLIAAENPSLFGAETDIDKIRRVIITSHPVADHSWFLPLPSDTDDVVKARMQVVIASQLSKYAGAHPSKVLYAIVDEKSAMDVLTQLQQHCFADSKAPGQRCVCMPALSKICTLVKT